MKQIFFCLILFFLLSCNKKSNNTNNNSQIDESNFGIEQSDFIFPDTIKVNESYNGEIKYKSHYDTFTTKSISDNKFGRAIFFSYLKYGNPDDTFEELIKKTTDTVLMKNVHNIPIQDIKYNKTGTFYIDGVLRDMVIFDTLTNNEEIPMKIQDTRIIKKVVVIE